MTDPDNPLAQPIVFGDYQITVNGEPIGLVADRVTVALDPEAPAGAAPLYHVTVTYLTDIAPTVDPESRYLKIVDDTPDRYVIGMGRVNATDAAVALPTLRRVETETQ